MTTHSPMRAFLVVTCLLAIAACASGPTAVPARGLAPRLADGDGLSNVAMVSPALYRGAQPDAAGYGRLDSMGVKTVISFRNFLTSGDRAVAAGLDYVSIPIYASIGSSAPTDQQVAQFFAIVLDPARQPVFMHCRHGEDRTGVMAALYRIECDGWTNDEAIAEMQAFGFRDIFRDLIDFVRDYKPRGFAAAGRQR